MIIKRNHKLLISFLTSSMNISNVCVESFDIIHLIKNNVLEYNNILFPPCLNIRLTSRAGAAGSAEASSGPMLLLLSTIISTESRRP